MYRVYTPYTCRGWTHPIHVQGVHTLYMYRVNTPYTCSRRHRTALNCLYPSPLPRTRASSPCCSVLDCSTLFCTGLNCTETYGTSPLSLTVRHCTVLAIIQFSKVMYTVLTEQYLMFYQGYFVRQIQIISAPLGLHFITFINWIMSVP